MGAMRYDATFCKALCLSALLVGCDQGKSVRKTTDDPRAESAVATADDAPSESAAAPKPAIALDDVPAIDLLTNEHRWHVYRGGLFIDFTRDGVQKYARAYKRPFADVNDSGRSVRATTLTFWWDGSTDASKLHLWGSGSVSVKLNGKSLGKLSPRDTSAATVDIGAGLLKRGENEVAVTAGRIKAMSIGATADAGELGAPVVADSKFGGDARPAMSGFDKARIWVELPANAYLQFAVGAQSEGAEFGVRLHTEDAEPANLASGPANAGEWAEHTIALDEYADRLVALEFTSKGPVAFAQPRIALGTAERRDRPKYENAILLVVDALRSDRLSLYAETRVRTPRTQAEANKRGVVFRNNQAASPSSPPSHGSIQTGMIPRVHGVAGDKGRIIAGTPMLSTVLGEAGLRTAYYGNNPFGMARLKTPGKWTEFHQPNAEGKGMDCGPVIDGILDFATRSKKDGKRFFISSLPYEPHTPYRYHEGITNRFYEGTWSKKIGKSVDGHLTSAIADGRTKVTDDEWQQILALYDGEVEHWDACFGDLMDGLSQRGLTQDTVVVLTSDHGEGMMEHGKMGHAYGHYFELANVPFVIFGDGLVQEGPRMIETVTNHIDIAPTVLALLGVKPPVQMQGESVVPLITRDGVWTPRVTSLEYGRSYALKSLRYKYIVQYNGTASLYDHKTDPTEQKDIIGDRPFVRRYFRELEGFFLTHRSQWRASTWGTLGNHAAGYGQD